MKPEHTTHMATQTTTPKTKRTEAKRFLTSQASQAPDIQTPVTHEAKPAPLPEIIHLGIDVHLRQYVVCRKIDGPRRSLLSV